MRIAFGRRALLEDLAGKRNATVIKSIITNIDDLTGAYEDAQNATGTVSEANQEYLDSIEGQQEVFQATWQDLSNSILDADFTQWITSQGTSLLSFLKELNSVFSFGGTNAGGLITTLGALGMTIYQGQDKGRPIRVSWNMPIYTKKCA